MKGGIIVALEEFSSYQQEYYFKNKDKIRARAKQWIKDNPEKRQLQKRKETLKQKYNLTIEDYDLIYNNQNGKCAICGRHQSELKQTLAVDHNHETGQIRSLLCHQCNHGLGLFYENKNSLLKAIEYLEKHSTW